MPEKPVYPFEALEYGDTREVAPGIHWIRMRLPFALNHVNLWLLEDGEGCTIVDTGYNNAETRGLAGPTTAMAVEAAIIMAGIFS